MRLREKSIENNKYNLPIVLNSCYRLSVKRHRVGSLRTPIHRSESGRESRILCRLLNVAIDLFPIRYNNYENASRRSTTIQAIDNKLSLLFERIACCWITATLRYTLP